MTKAEYRREHIHHLPEKCCMFLNSKRKWGKWIQLSIEHFIDLLHNSNYYYDYKDVDKKLKLLPFMTHFKGEMAGLPFNPEPFQVFLICAIFGFKKKSTNRRVIKEFYVSMARKNGKSFLLAVLAVLHLICDKEEGPEVYIVSTKEAQSMLLWRDITKIISKSKDLKKLFKVTHNLLQTPFNNGICRALGGDSKSQDGLNCSLGIVDEFHAHPSRAMYDIISSSQGARTQPLLGIITTAGLNTICPCKTQEEYCQNLLLGTFKNDDVFSMIFQLDKTDDPFDETKWYKSNPGLGVCKYIEQMEKECKQAQAVTSKKRDFLTKTLNIWVTDKSDWIKMDDWMKCKEEYVLENFKGKDCYIGVDMSKSSDLTCISLIFPQSNNIYIWPIFYIPNISAQEKELEDRVPYSEWEEEGWVTLTEQSIISQNEIRDLLLSICKDFNVIKVYYDAYQFTHLREDLDEYNIPNQPVPQNMLHLTPLINMFEEYIKLGKLKHPNNPCMNWNISNSVLKEGNNGLKKVVKDKGNQKIDGTVATLIGMQGIIDKNTTNNTQSQELTILQL